MRSTGRFKTLEAGSITALDGVSAPEFPAASASAAGIVELANNAEAKALQSTELAITPAALGNVLVGIKAISFDGKNGAGACTAVGAVDGDMVLAVFGLTSGSLGAVDGSFESVITVNDQIQQSAVGDLSTKDYVALLLAVA